MDLTSIIGIVVGTVLIVTIGIGPEHLGNFWDPASIAIVLGGTLTSIITSFPFSMLKCIPRHIKILFQGNRYDVGSLIDTLVEMAQLARKNGLLALEEKANELDDMFFQQGIMLIVDATEPEEVRDMMENELDTMSQRHEEAVAIYEKGSVFAPAFGMIGTLVGLINMLKDMDIDSGGTSSIGPNMATALITTFYGCILANMLFAPIAKKLRIRNEEELLYKQIMIEGILAIQSGDNPKFLKEKLVTYLAQDVRGKILDPENAAKAKKDKGEEEAKGKTKEKSKRRK